MTDTMTRLARLLALAATPFSLLFAADASSATEAGPKLRIGVAGLTHTHVHWIFESEKRNGDFEIVGIAEPNLDLARRYSEQHGYPMDRVYPTLEAMVEATSPQAITAFGTIREHLEVVRAAAPRGIHVMVEKPLAVSLDHAREMARLAREHGIHLLTNYETTWYPANHRLKRMVQAGNLGQLRKVVVHSGHMGPKKLGINSEFLDWLTDPVHNGAGALTDFGCYGANLMTWLNAGERPLSVTTIAQQLQPENNPKVEDEATIVVTYPASQAIIQASWNWPVSRKDMEVYGLTGQAVSIGRSSVRWQRDERAPEETETLDARPYPHDDPFSLLSAVIAGRVTLDPHDPSALENNLVVMEILQAAIDSMKSGRTIRLE